MSYILRCNLVSYELHLFRIICQESHAKTLSSLTKTDENLTASLMSITALESTLSAAGDKYVFMQKLRDFISVICDFMQVCLI